MSGDAKVLASLNGEEGGVESRMSIPMQDAGSEQQQDGSRRRQKRSPHVPPLLRLLVFTDPLPDLTELRAEARAAAPPPHLQLPYQNARSGARVNDPHRATQTENECVSLGGARMSPIQVRPLRRSFYTASAIRYL